MNASPREALGLLVRIAGLAALFYGIYGEVYTVLHQTGVVVEARYSTKTYAVLGAVQILFGLIVVLGADRITRACYKD